VERWCALQALSLIYICTFCYWSFPLCCYIHLLVNFKLQWGFCEWSCGLAPELKWLCALDFSILLLNPLKLPMNLKCHHFFNINPLDSPSPSLKAFVVFIKRNQGKHSFVASSSKIIVDKGVNCLIFTSRSMLPWNLYFTLAPKKQKEEEWEIN
jgi:hypothetical protein